MSRLALTEDAPKLLDIGCCGEVADRIQIIYMLELHQTEGFGTLFFYDVLPLLQILAKRIIVDVEGEIVEAKLNKPVSYLYSLEQHLSAPRSGDGGSEHVRLGVLLHKSNFHLLSVE